MDKFKALLKEHGGAEQLLANLFAGEPGAWKASVHTVAGITPTLEGIVKANSEASFNAASVSTVQVAALEAVKSPIALQGALVAASTMTKLRVLFHPGGLPATLDFLRVLGTEMDLSKEDHMKLLTKCRFGMLQLHDIHQNILQNSPEEADTAELDCEAAILSLVSVIANPSKCSRHVLYVNDEIIGDIISEMISADCEHSFIIHAKGASGGVGFTEYETTVWDIREGKVERKIIRPGDLGESTIGDFNLLKQLSAKDSVEVFRAAFGSDSNDTAIVQSLRQICIFNAAAIVYTSGNISSLQEAAEVVRSTIASGHALDVADNHVASSQTVKEVGSGQSDILTIIAKQRQIDVDEQKKTVSTEEIIKASLNAPKCLSLPTRLLDALPTAIMAEIKRASPSRGNIAMDINATEQAYKYARGGAAAISVLTEPKWFKGTLDDMRAVREKLEGLENRPAVLRKDFIVDEYQIYEARAYGADTILLIVAILEDEQIQSFLAIARTLGMEPLVEVANVDEMKRAVSLGAEVIGINNRNLRDFTVDPQTTTKVLQGAGIDPSSSDSKHIICALSGISTRMDVQRYRASGVHAMLVGESLMKAKDPTSKIAELRGLSDQVLVKICGLKTAQLARLTVGAGADMIGLVFAPGSSRLVSIETAKEIADAVRSSCPAKQADLDTIFEEFYSASDEVPFSTTLDTLRKAASHRCLVFGVFANQPVSEVNQIAQAVGLDIIQLSGDEGIGSSQLYCRPVVKAIHIYANDTKQNLSPSDIVKSVTGVENLPIALLLDTKVGSQLGGTGVTFDWKIAMELGQQFGVYVAGGLNVANIADAVRLTKAYGVDVSSGVETEREKDPEKIVAFIRNAKTAFIT